MEERLLLGKEAEKFVGISVPKSVLTRDINVASKFVKNYPAVLKIISQKAIHKSDIDGVKIVDNEKGMRSSFEQLLQKIKKHKMKDATIMVQEFVSGREMILGVKNDTTFGKVIGFGTGGKYVEIFDDIAFRACPIDEKEANDMIEQLKFKKILEGIRGEKKVNMKELTKILIMISKLAVSKNISELDINPLIVSDKIYAVDVRVVL